MVKICDFGLTKDMHDSEYYRTEDRNKEVPIRWMSIEAIQCGIFSIQSDMVYILFCTLKYLEGIK